MTPFEKLYWIRSFGATVRFHTERFVGVPQTVFHHSASMAMILLMIAPDCRAELLQAVLQHDLEEGTTGDIPAPAKWAMGHCLEGPQPLKDLEEAIREHYAINLLQLTEEENQLLKMADFLDATFTCLEQRMMGNRFIERVFNNYRNYERRVRRMEGNQQAQMLWTAICGAFNSESNAYNAWTDSAEQKCFNLKNGD